VPKVHSVKGFVGMQAAVSHYVFSTTARKRSECSHFDAEVLRTPIASRHVIM